MATTSEASRLQKGLNVIKRGSFPGSFLMPASHLSLIPGNSARRKESLGMPAARFPGFVPFIFPFKYANSQASFARACPLPCLPYKRISLASG